MKNLLCICCALALLSSCNKETETTQPFSKNLLFTYDGKIYSSNYYINTNDAFVWENIEVGEFYENLLASNPVIKLAGDTVNVLSGTEAEVARAEYKSKIESFEEKKGAQTKALEIKSFRFATYFNTDFSAKMDNKIVEGVDQVEEDAYQYEYLTAHGHDGYNSYIPKSLTFVVLRQEENSFYPKYNAKLILQTTYMDKYGKIHQQNYVELSTEKLGYSIKIPDLSKVGIKSNGQLGSNTVTHVSVW